MFTSHCCTAVHYKLGVRAKPIHHLGSEHSLAGSSFRVPQGCSQVVSKAGRLLWGWGLLLSSFWLLVEFSSLQLYD